jgi:D-sedoheptulose 7-phosphate isomerase
MKTPRSRNDWKAPDGRHALGFLVNLDEIQKEVQAAVRPGGAVPLQDGFARAIRLMTGACRKGRKLIFIGNGGSAAISSHQAVDYWKNGGLESVAFNDASLLTCIGNDCGYENVFAKPMERFAKSGDVVLAISSSGKSPNILNGVKAARAAGCGVVTLSGFNPSNPLRSLGDVNFFVPSQAYGLVEVSHLALIHAMLREIIYINPRANKKGY